MRLLKWVVSLYLFMCLTQLAVAAPVMSTTAKQADTSHGPVALLQSISDHLIDGLRGHQKELKENTQVVYDLVDKIIMPHIDTYAMTRIVLGRSGYQDWKKADKKTQKAFELEFKDLVVGTYVSALQAFDNEKVKVYPPRVPVTDQKRVRINAKILNNGGPPTAMSYVFKREGDTWKIIDFSVEGISLIQSYQSQFQSILSSGGGLAHLVETLQKHNDEEGQEGS